MAVDPNNENVIYVGGYTYDGNYYGALFKTINGGANWERVWQSTYYQPVMALALNPKAPNHLIMGTTQGTYVSDTGGQSWAQTSSTSTYALLLNPLSPSQVYAGGWGSVRYSSDGGTTWGAWNASPPLGSPPLGAASDAPTAASLPNNVEIAALAFDRFNYFLYAGTLGSSVWKSRAEPGPPPGKDDFVGTWSGQGVYYRNSDSGAFVQMATPADLLVAGDLDQDMIGDLIGTWPSQGGIWVLYSANGAWQQLSSTARHVAVGDMNGDGRQDLLGTWDGQGVFYRDSASGTWHQMATAATLITSGDLDQDGKGDLIGIWPGQGGVWVKYSATGNWERLASTAQDIAAGDMNGDGRADLLASWNGQGVFYRDSASGLWIQMATPADQVTCGDMDQDGKKDLIGIWPGQGGVWAKYSQTGAWERLSSTATDITAGPMRQAVISASLSPVSLESSAKPVFESSFPFGREARIVRQENLVPGGIAFTRISVPGPGERGFTFIKEKGLSPTRR